MPNQVKPNQQTLRKLRYAAAMLSAAAVFATWSGLQKASALETVDVTLKAVYLVLTLLVIWLHIAQSPFRQIYWGWAALFAGGFCMLFFAAMTMLSLQVGDGARCMLGCSQSVSAICALLSGWVLVFDKDLNEWRNQLRIGGPKMVR